MLNVGQLNNGFVLDHIEAGKSMMIYNNLGLDKLDCQVAIIKNARSNKMGKKDIIKIENVTDVDFTVLALLSPGITINEVKNEQIIKKIKPPLPQKISGILKCNNPRCITSDEKYLEDVFDLVDENKGSYKCQYCDTIINPSEV